MAFRHTRRKFIQTTSLGAAGLALGGIVQSAGRAYGYVPRDEINPNISNLRVVFVHDHAMTTVSGPVSGWSNQNVATNDAVVAANMDKMACALAQRADIAEAWQTIFMKPPAKQWSEVVVAIKTNNIADQHTRNAVMEKMCEVLVNHVGVVGTNIHIYDATHGGNMMTTTPWYGLPPGVQIERTWGGHNTWVSLPLPYGASSQCVASIATGMVDILINIALCKGHNWGFGNFTMCLKNHYGTFTPSCDPGVGGNPTDYLLSINKSEAILGPMDPGSGRIITARQQLCFIDALWGSQGGPNGEPTDQPNRFFMGTFGPVVDYQVATKFRRDTRGWSINESVVARFLSEFGYAPSDIPDNEAMIDAMTWSPSRTRANPRWSRYE